MSTVYSYVPLLEGHPGTLYLTNNNTQTLVYQNGAGGLVDPLGALNNNVLAFSGSLGSGQGRVSLAYDSVSTKTKFVYNGANWDPTMSDMFGVSLTLRDIAFVNTNGEYDLYPFIPAAPLTGGGGGGVEVPGSGGSSAQFQVWALSVPEVAAVSPVSVPSDNTYYWVNITLKRRLHSSQNPVVSVVADVAPSTATGLTITPTFYPTKNSAGQITGWSFSVKAPAGAAAEIAHTLTINLSENITYLKNDIIVTETVNYPSTTVDFVTHPAAWLVDPLTAGTASLTAGAVPDSLVGVLTTFTPPATGGGSGTGGSGTGGSGSTCPAPWEPILMADDTEIPAGELVVGSLVKTKHEVTGEWGVFPVTSVFLGTNKRWKLTLEDGRDLVAAWNHWMFRSDGSMVALANLKPGDILDGALPGVVSSVGAFDEGSVVFIAVEDGHTYQNKGLTSHNNIKVQTMNANIV